jgi:hypothetical protein
MNRPFTEARRSPAQQLAEAMKGRPKPNKYRNKPVEVDGIRFASVREANRYSQLKQLERAGEIVGLELQPRFPLRVNDFLVCTYVGDFAYSTTTPPYVERIVEDAKGFRTREYQIKARLFHAIFGFPVTEV